MGVAASFSAHVDENPGSPFRKPDERLSSSLKTTDSFQAKAPTLWRQHGTSLQQLQEGIFRYLAGAAYRASKVRIYRQLLLSRLRYVPSPTRSSPAAATNTQTIWASLNSERMLPFPINNLRPVGNFYLSYYRLCPALADTTSVGGYCTLRESLTAIDEFHLFSERP